ncbi:hypothetical protein [Flavobacterium sp. C4GT6]|uniref:hypothetical protein n=1 Tax=Flavobacterium sp. C4GT6 TaxID=3103818 RepID=UPI002ED60164
MTFQNLSDVTAAMKEWENIRNNPSGVVNYLTLGNHITFIKNEIAEAVHVYPGISKDSNELYFFLIDKEQDIQQSDADLFNAITICKADLKNLSALNTQENTPGNSTDEISEAEARVRTQDWDRNYADWAEKQITLTTDGIFKAFYMPANYMAEGSEYESFLALKPNSQSPTLDDADIVTTFTDSGKTTYYDTVMPMPPYTINNPSSSFYLLQLL